MVLMTESRFTHTSVLADDLNESVAWYQRIFGMESIPAPDFDVPVQWLRCGDLELHLFQRDIEPAPYFHFGLHVDDFEEIYQAVLDGHIESDSEGLGTNEDVEAESPTVYELPDGSIQLYIRDPTGNVIEVNYHDVDDIDRDIVSEITPRETVTEQSGEALDAQLYLDGLLTTLEEDRVSSASD